MAMRDFNLPETPADTEVLDPARQKRKRLIGGSLELRRQNGKPSQVHGPLVLDPVFYPDQEQTLKTYCSPSDPRPLLIEIGFQMGEFAAAMLEQTPGVRYVGFEVRAKYCNETGALFESKGLSDVWLALVDAREVMPRVLEPGSVDTLFVFFPDPWWKPRHIKKRLLYADFIADCAVWLKPGGRLLLKTDVLGYADWAEGELRGESRFETKRLLDPTATLPPTLRERRCAFHGYPTYAVEAIRL